MSIQTGIQTFESNPDDLPSWIDDHPDPPDDGELKQEIAPNELFPYDVEQIDGIHTLRQRIRDAEYATDRITAWSQILGDYINSSGNAKIGKSIDIWNFGAAHDCLHLGSDRCQVDEDDCYAVKNEKDFPKPIHYRRKQHIIWVHLDAASWAQAYREYYCRKRSKPIALRLNESGDFRTRQDILKTDEIARRINDIVDTYTYSASSHLDWSEKDHFVVNRSDHRFDYGERDYIVVDSVDEIPDGGLRCPHDQSDGEIKCGANGCTLCISSDAPDIYVSNFY
jgi:hypothetical protein